MSVDEGLFDTNVVLYLLSADAMQGSRGWKVVALGISRRMVSYYRIAHKAIPRAIWLSCPGWEATPPCAEDAADAVADGQGVCGGTRVSGGRVR